MAKTRQKRSDSADALLEAQRAVASDPIQPPAHVRLPKRALAFWTPIIHRRARAEWNDADLILAAEVAVCHWRMSIEWNRAKPDHALADKLTRRAVHIMRALQIVGSAHIEKRDLDNKRDLENKARELAEEVKAEEQPKSELLA